MRWYYELKSGDEIIVEGFTPSLRAAQLELVAWIVKTLLYDCRSSDKISSRVWQ